MEPYASYPSEMIGDAVETGGIRFHLGPRGDGQRNALTCAGQVLTLPEGTRRAHLLVAATLDNSGVRPLHPLFPDLIRDGAFEGRFNKP